MVKMIKAEWSRKLYLIAAVLLMESVSSAAKAAPVTFPSGEVIDLSAEQVKLLKQDPSIYYFEYRPQRLISGKIQHWILIELPEELGGGFLIGTNKNIATGLAAVGIVEIPSPQVSLSTNDTEVSLLTSRDTNSGSKKTQMMIDRRWQWSFSTGYRNDDLNWSIAGITPTIDLLPALQGNFVNVLSELTWTDLQIFQMEFGLERLIHQKYKIKGTLAYGVISDGDNRDSDYAGNNRTFEFSRSNNSADDGSTWDGSIGFGLNFPFLTDAIEFSPLIGFSYHAQKLTMTDGVHTVSDFGWTTPLGPFPGLDSSYDTQWYGPWVGLELTARKIKKSAPASSYEIFFSIEYHWTDYHAEADWNLRPDFAHPKSFEHDADGTGWVYVAGFDYAFDPQWSLNITGKYQEWETDPGIDRVFFFDGTIAETPLNEVNWESFSLMVGITCRF